MGGVGRPTTCGAQPDGRRNAARPPPLPGDYTFAVRVADSSGRAVTASLQITVGSNGLPAPPPPLPPSPAPITAGPAAAPPAAGLPTEVQPVHITTRSSPEPSRAGAPGSASSHSVRGRSSGGACDCRAACTCVPTGSCAAGPRRGRSFPPCRRDTTGQSTSAALRLRVRAR